MKAVLRNYQRDVNRMSSSRSCSGDSRGQARIRALNLFVLSLNCNIHIRVAMPSSDFSDRPSHTLCLFDVDGTLSLARQVSPNNMHL